MPDPMDDPALDDDSADDTAPPASGKRALADDREPDGPNRRCILSRAVRRRDAMLRFVVAPDGLVVPDLDARLPGRGLWLSPGRDVVETAAAKGVFARAAKRAVVLPPDLAERVDRLLEERCIDLVGLARKAGQAVAGFEKVKSWVHTGRAGMVLEAWDGSEGGRAKLGAETWGMPVFRAMDRLALGRAFAREQAVHAAVEPGGLARRLEADLIRLARLRGRLDGQTDAAGTDTKDADRKSGGPRSGHPAPRERDRRDRKTKPL
ncbi:hypothetical protein CKO38_13060 [Rhodospirillum rubrum]|nr:hypothetical protein [Rhodospirillum rubrum]MBK1677580.1 hypothetical protein [Rhodospirillum rubrum]